MSQYYVIVRCKLMTSSYHRIVEAENIDEAIELAKDLIQKELVCDRKSLSTEAVMKIKN